jgi:glycosidase
MAWMDNYRAGLSHQQQLRMFNQLDSHDTARFKRLYNANKFSSCSAGSHGKGLRQKGSLLPSTPTSSRAGLSHQQQLRMFNQLDSHDTARFKSLLGKDVARLPLAVVWLFCWPGV